MYTCAKQKDVRSEVNDSLERPNIVSNSDSASYLENENPWMGSAFSDY